MSQISLPLEDLAREDRFFSCSCKNSFDLSRRERIEKL